MWRSLANLVMGRRDQGFPTSGNGASSMHLHWMGITEAVEASVVVEVIEPPVVDSLYFWALQATFAPGSTGAHLGLQWNPRHPSSTAVNWGGYDGRGGLLEGTESTIPSTIDDPNTRSWSWLARRRYRLRIGRGRSSEWWTGEVTDLATDETVEVRQLRGGGEFLTGLMVWSEVFASCDAPSVAVRWSDSVVVDPSGSVISPPEVRVSYQDYVRGGCTNTNTAADDSGIVQRTNTDRTTPPETLLQW